MLILSNLAKLKKERWAAWLGLGLLIVGLSACGQQAVWPAQEQATWAVLNIADTASICSPEHLATSGTGFLMLLGAGLLTGISHCVGMCGPLVSAFVMRRRCSGQEVSTPLVSYQLGRLTSYALLGLLVGGLGSLAAKTMQNWQGLFSVLLGVLIVVMGLSLVHVLPFQRWLARLTPTRTVSRWIQRWLSSSHPAAPFSLGLANGLLPCGAVYAMLMLAAVTGDPFKAAGVMLVFGLGTLITMLAFSFSAALMGLRLRSYLYHLAAVLVVLVGVQLTLRGLALFGQIPHTAIGGVVLW